MIMMMAQCPFTRIVVLISALVYAVVTKELEHVVDLTWPINEQIVTWPNSQPFKFTQKLAEHDAENRWYARNDFCSSEHTGTHFDAPYHFNETGRKVGDIPVEDLIAPGILIDVHKETYKHGANATLTSKHIKDWISKHGPLPDRCMILVRFGWSQYFQDHDKYLGSTTDGKLQFPGISVDAAKWIADSNKVLGVGLDTASVDPGSTEGFNTHRILANKGIFFFENVRLTEHLPARNFVLIAMPMKIEAGTGAPLRLVAVPSNLSRFFRKHTNKKK